MSGIEIITTQAQASIALREKVKVKDISQAMGRLYGEIYGYMEKKGIPLAGPPFAYYHAWSEQEVDLECGFPTVGTVKGEGRFETFTLPSVRAVVGMHIGPYPDIVKTYTEVQKWMKENAHQPADQMWEVYLNDPSITPPEKLMTQIVWPLK
jgi:effector-binding domain-containing protein